MTAQIIQFVPKPNPKRKSLEDQAIEIIRMALKPEGLGLEFGCDIYESSLGWLPQDRT